MSAKADHDHDDAEPAGALTQRLDKWLWFARITKSRTTAATAIADGRIKLNQERVEKPSQTVKAGDVITSRIQKTVRILRVAAIGRRRGPAPEARTLYEDLTPAPGAEPRLAMRSAGSGRPTKRDRRQIDQLKGRHS